ncbi:hypothetical protein V6N13_088704 [Hibiscus sabdariffa]
MFISRHVIFSEDVFLAASDGESRSNEASLFQSAPFKCHQDNSSVVEPAKGTLPIAVISTSTAAQGEASVPLGEFVGYNEGLVCGTECVEPAVISTSADQGEADMYPEMPAHGVTESACHAESFEPVFSSTSTGQTAAEPARAADFVESTVISTSADLNNAVAAESAMENVGISPMLDNSLPSVAVDMPISGASIHPMMTRSNDNHVLEMVSKLPKNYYVHVYLEVVLITTNAANVEPKINVEVSDIDNVEHIVSDDDSVEENIVEP